MKLKRTLALFLALVTALSLFPLTAIEAAAEGVTEYDIWIAGVRVTSETIADPPASWGGTTYDPATNTLTLDYQNTDGESYPVDGDTFVSTTLNDLNIKGTLISEGYPAYSFGIVSSWNFTVVDDLHI